MGKKSLFFECTLWAATFLLAVLNTQATALQALEGLVHVTVTRAGDVGTRGIKAPGKLIAERFRIEKARSSGRLKTFFFRTGEWVKLGEELFEIENESEGFVYIPFRQKALEPGVISKKMADVGSSVQLGEPVLHLYDPKSLRLQLRLPQSAFPHVYLGQRVLASSIAGDFHGQVTEIEKRIDPQTLSFCCWATPTNHEEIASSEGLLSPEEVYALPAGMTFSALLFRSDEKMSDQSLFSVPEEAIVFSEGNTFLFLVEKIEDHRGVAFRQQVDLMRVERDRVVVSLPSQALDSGNRHSPLIILRGASAIGQLEKCDVLMEEV